MTPAVSYVQAQRVRSSFRRDMLKAIEPFDVIMTPSTTSPAPKDLSTTGDPRFQIPWTSCGFPAITLPSGLSRSGLPLGIQLAASALRGGGPAAGRPVVRAGAGYAAYASGLSRLASPISVPPLPRRHSRATYLEGHLTSTFWL